MKAVSSHQLVIMDKYEQREKKKKQMKVVFNVDGSVRESTRTQQVLCLSKHRGGIEQLHHGCRHKRAVKVLGAAARSR